MTVSYRFFENGDFYSQENFADFVRTLLTDGYVPNIGSGLSVSAASPADMTVEVGTGMAYVHGYIVEVENDAVSLTIDTADETNPRIDRVVARMSATSNRNITFAVLKGTPAATPTAPALTQTEETWELPLAQVAVAAGALSITAADITDERVPCYNMGAGLPNASSTVKGLVQIGAGITNINGLISVPGIERLVIKHITSTNNGRSVVGNISDVITAAAGTTSYSSSGFETVIDNYKPQRTYKVYEIYAINNNTLKTYAPVFTINVSCKNDNSFHCSARAFRNGIVSDILAELAEGSGKRNMSITLPADWDYNTDYITIQVDNCNYRSTSSASITASTQITTLYENPTLEDIIV